MTLPSDAVPKYKIRDIEISGFSDQAHFVDFLLGDEPKQGALVAINAEKVMTAETNAALRELIDAAEFKYADGISIVKSIRRKYGVKNLQRIAGADLWEGLMAKAGEKAIPVFLVGGKPEVLQETAAKLCRQWNVKIVGMQDGYFSAQESPALYEKIRESGAQFVTVAMGSPKQELFIKACRQVHPDALYMGVGGTYDVFTGHVKRAPKMWQNMGLEWLYRLLSQPTRWRRQGKLLKYLFLHYTNKL